MKIASILRLFAVSASLFAASIAAAASDENQKLLRVGVAPGPYGDIFLKGIAPGLERLGYKVKVVQFQDYVQPDLALENGETELNLFQHQPYLEKFSADHGLHLAPVITIPTAELGLFGGLRKSLKDLKPGDEVTITQDPTNLARGLRFLQAVGLIKLKADIDQTKASLKDIAENPYGLKITPIEAAQVPRSLDSVAIAVVNGNYAISAGLKLSDALVLENLPDNLHITLTVRAADRDKKFVSDLKTIIESREFHDVIADPKNNFDAFSRPAWFKARWSTPATTSDVK
jgi:D-methionine transport system substrate-binding protein